MKHTRKLLALLFALCCCLSLVSCGKGTVSNTSEEAVSSQPEPTQTASKLSIVTTIFPQYDWVEQILSDSAANAEVTLLLDSGVDLHNYQPTAEDILKISNCDLFIYTGGESDNWVEDALAQSTNPDLVAINLLETLGEDAKEEEIVKGMEDEHGNEGDESHEEDPHEDGEGPEYDEHIWLSLKNAQVLCSAISDVLAEIDPDNADTYAANTRTYLSELEALDGEYQAAVDAGAQKTLLFGDRFPFRYMVDDYGLDYYAAFAGCSAETEASFETISFLASKVDELGLRCVMTLEGTDHKLAQTIVQTTESKDQQLLSMDSMQNITAEDVNNGASYLDIMRSNLEVLKTALA